MITGCTFQIGSGNQPVVAGVFKSFDKGDNWVEKNVLLSSGGIGNIRGLSVLGLTFDPQDYRAIYLTSSNYGLFYTYNGGDNWSRSNQVQTGRIESVMVDPKNKCIIYATMANTILKSVDCSRSWKEVYIDTRTDKALTALAIDFYNSAIIYAGNSAGDLFRSSDSGVTWQVIKRINNTIAKILIYPKDSHIIYVATKNQGIFKTTNGGVDWNQINEGLRPFSGSMEYKNLIFIPSLDSSLLLVSKYGLIKTTDGGSSWQDIKLITPPTSTDILAVAINPANADEIYYATASTFYKTYDGGRNWITKRLPSNAAASYLLIDPSAPNVIYLGFNIPTKK
jgi:photosystem II stability/assembly factor-like uncharacterized protein